ncbi:HD domain-containing phosphohydrolase [Bermanella sp. R86510]|uniref:HD domain-containing phosphohydrolase n=1 Tax=unclassified Bermanella TaxID=2627862 RepID=UPI0037CBE925
MSDSDLLFSQNEPSQGLNDTSEPTQQSPWRILVIDDEEQVHKVTALVLGSCVFDQKPIELVHAYSMAEAKYMLEKQGPFALALVDVVMETDDAGLQLIAYIRDELADKNIRLVLRTGQPGQAPEETVIAQYDINDYKNKTELTSTKLKTLLYSTLRSYRDILALEANRQGLYNLIDATSKIVDTQQLPVFASAVLEEIGNLLNLDSEAVCTHTPVDAVAAKTQEQQYDILAATGEVKKILRKLHRLPNDITQYFNQAKEASASIHDEQVYVGYYNTRLVGENLLYVKPNAPLKKMGRHLLDIYTRCVAITHNNLTQKDAVKRSRQELVYVLSETIERRQPDESNHVRRVSKMAALLAEASGQDNNFCERIKLAAPLHDIGTIGIPDSVLTKRGVYTDEDRALMAKHTEIGEAILGKSDKPVLKMASEIAAQHHEHWDGNGAPKGLAGEDITLAARIVTLVDVIDALGCHKSYRSAFKKDEVIQFIKDNQGKIFDPKLAQAALDIMDDFTRIRLHHPDAM